MPKHMPLECGFFNVTARSFTKACVGASALACLLLIHASASAASKSCQILFEAEDPQASALSASRLSAEQIKIIKQSPLARYAAKLNAKTKIDFRSSFFDVEFTQLAKGEYIQAQYLKLILQQLFPTATFSNRLAPEPRGRKVVKMYLAEVGEVGNNFWVKKILDKGLVVPMHLVKPANSTSARYDKKSMRRQLGIPERRKVISLYVRSEDTMTDLMGLYGLFQSKFIPLFKVLNAKFPTATVILTFGNHVKQLFNLRTTGVLDSGIEFKETLELSALGSDVAVRTKGPILVENDTLGRMKEIHAAADLAIVVGPVNFFEPLSLGTPTLLIRKSHSEARNSDYGHFDGDIYNGQIELALKTGGARVVSFDRLATNLEVPIAKAIEELMASSQPIEDISLIALPGMLQGFLKHLRYQIEQYDPKDFEGTGMYPTN